MLNGLELASGLRLKNRLVKSAMTEDLSDEFGQVSNDLIQLYELWTEKSDIGMLITGNVQVDRRHVERARNVCIDKDFGKVSDYQMKMLKKWVTVSNRNNTRIICQLAHAGRQSNTLVVKAALSPGTIPTYRGSVPMSTAVMMSETDIAHVIDKFVFAASVCKEAGFDGIQLHAAHGYLLSSFLNPLANNRSDPFGGSLENRMRFLLVLVRRVREVCGKDFTLGVKLNSADFQKGGFSVEDCVIVAKSLAKENIDFLEISGGNYESIALLTGNVPNATRVEEKLESTKRREAYFLDFALRIQQELKRTNQRLALMVTGGFRRREVIEEALKQIDLIGIGRPLCVDPGCTKQLLQKQTDCLPCPELNWRLGFIMGSRLFQKLQYFAKRQFFAIQATLQHNLFLMTQPGWKPMSDTEYPNIEERYLERLDHERKRALLLKGFSSDDPFVHDHLKPPTEQ